MNLDVIQVRVRQSVAESGEMAMEEVTLETELIGPNSAVKSRALVEVLLDLEEFAEESLGAEFDWTSDAAMSQSRSIFRTIGTLAGHLHGLQS
jgi:hypothetical protein